MRRRVVLVTTTTTAAVVMARFAGGDTIRGIGSAAGGMCHAAAYGCLLVYFAWSLRAGSEPVVTRFARRMRATMPLKVIRYTRCVTQAWCVFFAGQLIASAALLAWASPGVWSGFVTLLNLPLLAGMILAEFGCRLMLFRREQRTGLLATLSGVRLLRGSRP